MEQHTYKLDTTMTVSLKEVEEFVTSDKFTQFLLNNTTDFAVAAYVLQTLLNAIEKDAAESVNEEND